MRCIHGKWAYGDEGCDQCAAEIVKRKVERDADPVAYDKKQMEGFAKWVEVETKKRGWT